MKIHRFIDPTFDLSKPTLAITDREVINQWKNVLRLTVGEKLIISNGNGFEAEAEITKLTGDMAEVALGTNYKNQNDPAKTVTLYCAILKKENFELVVQKAVEIGISNIVPITTDRTVKQNLRFDRLEKIAKEAAEQSGRGIIPTISPIVDFKNAIKQATGTKESQTFLFDLYGSAFSKTYPLTTDHCSLFIGPEGGFTETEVAAAKESGAIIASLGPLTLRGETAAIVASYLAVNLV